MLLNLFIIFISLSLVLIALGLFKSEHTELALIGFFFLFLLALNFEFGTIQYKIGENYTYSCLCCNNETIEQRDIGTAQLCNTESAVLAKTGSIDNYANWDGGGTFGHIVGYYLAVMSAIGFIGVLVGIRGQRF